MYTIKVINSKKLNYKLCVQGKEYILYIKGQGYYEIIKGMEALVLIMWDICPINERKESKKKLNEYRKSELIKLLNQYKEYEELNNEYNLFKQEVYEETTVD